MTETDREAARVITCDAGILVVRRHGSARAEDWTAHAHLPDLITMISPNTGTTQIPDVTVTMRLGELIDQLAHITDAEYGGQP